MSKTYEASEVPPDDECPPCPGREAERAKLYLQRFCPAAGDNLYDHLSEILSRILAERPRNAFDAFDEYNRKLRDEKFRLRNDFLQEPYVPPSLYKDAVKLIELFKVNVTTEDDFGSTEEGNEEVQEGKKVLPNLFDLMYYFEQTDVGFPRAEVLRLNLSMRKLIATTKIENARLWGKILGRSRNYYVVEANLPEDEIERRLQELEGGEHEDASVGSAASALTGSEEAADRARAEKQALNAALSADPPAGFEGEYEGTVSGESLKLEFPPLPANAWRPEPRVSPERLGSGANAKMKSTRNVTVFEGDKSTKFTIENNMLSLETLKWHYPLSNGLIFFYAEKVRHGLLIKDGHIIIVEGIDEYYVQNTSTQQSQCAPKVRGAEATEEEFAVKSDYEGEEDDEEEEADDLENELNGKEGDPRFEREIALPLLTPLSEDTASNSLAPWTARQSSKIQPDLAVALLRSNVWPGAFAFAANKKFANLYIGWGNKHNAYNYSPPAMPPVQDQYPMDSELVEIQDPSFEDEEAYRIAHLPPNGEEEEEEEEDFEEPDDDN